jgi:hypothetical protein
MSNEEIPYQVAPQVEALQQERANCVAYGNKPRVAQIDRQLADLGVKAKAAEERKAAADPEDAKSKPPQGRSSKPADKAAQKDD